MRKKEREGRREGRDHAERVEMNTMVIIFDRSTDSTAPFFLILVRAAIGLCVALCEEEFASQGCCCAAH